MKSTISFLFILLLIILSCRGQQGPVGPMGPAGESGGGTRIIYNGTAASDEHEVIIPELHVDDMPSINCYYLLDGAWSELYIDYEDNGTAVFPFALIEEQLVIMYNLNGLDYQIVLVF